MLDSILALRDFLGSYIKKTYFRANQNNIMKNFSWWFVRNTNGLVSYINIQFTIRTAVRVQPNTFAACMKVQMSLFCQLKACDVAGFVSQISEP